MLIKNSLTIKIQAYVLQEKNEIFILLFSIFFIVFLKWMRKIVVVGYFENSSIRRLFVEMARFLHDSCLFSEKSISILLDEVSKSFSVFKLT